MARPTSRMPIFSTLENATSFFKFFWGSMDRAAMPMVRMPNTVSIGAMVTTAVDWCVIAYMRMIP